MTSGTFPLSKPKIPLLLKPSQTRFLSLELGPDLTAAAKSLQSCPTLCNPMDCSPSGFSVHGILQARILDWLPCPPPRDPPDPGIEPASLMSPALAGGFFTTNTTWETPDSTRYILNVKRI